MAKIVGMCGHVLKGPLSPSVVAISSYSFKGKYTALVCSSCRGDILKIMGYNIPTEFNYAGGFDQLPAKEKESNGR